MKIKNILILMLVIFSMNIASASYLPSEITSIDPAYERIAVLSDESIVVAFTNELGQGCVKAGQKSGDEFVYGSTYIFDTNTTVLRIDIERNSNNGFTVVFAHGSNTYVKAGTVSGDVITLGDLKSMGHPFSSLNACGIAHTTENNFIVVYGISSGTIYARYCTLTNDYDISVDPTIRIIPAINYASTFDIKPIDAHRYMVCYQLRIQYGPSSYDYHTCGVIGNYTSTFFGTPVILTSLKLAHPNLRIIDDSTFGLVFTEGGSYRGVVMIGTFSGLLHIDDTYAYFDIGTVLPVFDYLDDSNFRIYFRTATEEGCINGSYTSSAVQVDTSSLRVLNVGNIDSDAFSDGSSGIVTGNSSGAFYRYWDITPPYIGEYTPIFNDLFSDLSVWAFLSVIFGTYETFCGGNLFWLVIIVIPFIMTWIKQGSVIIPSMIALLCGSSLFVLLPVEAVTPIKYLLIIGIAGVFYHIIKSR